MTKLGQRFLAGAVFVLSGVVALVATRNGETRDPRDQPSGESVTIQRTLGFEADSAACEALVGRGDTDRDVKALRAICDADTDPVRPVDSLSCLELDGIIEGYRCDWSPRDGGPYDAGPQPFGGPRPTHRGIFDRCACSVWVDGNRDVALRATLDRVASNALIDTAPADLPTWARRAPNLAGQDREKLQPAERVYDAGPQAEAERVR